MVRRLRLDGSWPCILGAVAVVLCTGLILTAAACTREEERDLVVVSFGGAYQDAQRKAYFLPYSEEVGARVVEGEYDGDYALLKSRARSRTPTWDVVSVESAVCARGTQEGIYAKLPEGIYDGLSLVQSARREFCAGHLIFSTIMAYSEEAFGDRAPNTWRDFWDLEKFPGKRALRNNPRGTLEIALLADGVDPKNLYPLDVDRAFQKLDDLRGALVFWESGAQPVQLLANRTVSITSAYNGRIWNAVNEENQPFAWSWSGGLVETEYWAILGNSRRFAAAAEFVRSSLMPNRQANFVREIAYGPTNIEALGRVQRNIRQVLPNASEERLAGQVFVDADWWADHEEALSKRWDLWRSRSEG